MAKQLTKVSVTQTPEAPIEKNVLAAAIVDISRSFRMLTASGLTRRAVIALVHDLAPSVSKTAIKTVLEGLKDLESQFVVR